MMERLHARITTSSSPIALTLRQAWRFTARLLMFLTLPLFPRRLMRFLRLFERNLEYYKGHPIARLLRKDPFFYVRFDVLVDDPFAVDSTADPDVLADIVDRGTGRQRAADARDMPFPH